MIVLPYGALHLRIYGFHPTPYMLGEQAIGFEFSRLGWKTYLLLIEPRPWYPGTVRDCSRAFPGWCSAWRNWSLIVVSRRGIRRRRH